DGKCDDGILCNGVERCDTTFGCAAGPPACDLGLACSVDTCDEASQKCTHAQSFGCAPSVRLLVVDSSGNFLSISPFGGPPPTLAASVGTTHLDVAILNGRWFTMDTGQLVELVPMTNKVKAHFNVPTANSLGAGPDGKLYAASTAIYRL